MSFASYFTFLFHHRHHFFCVHHWAFPNCKNHMKIAFHIYCVGNSPKVIFFFSQYLEVFFTIIDELLFRTTDHLRITCISSQPDTPGWSCKSYYLFSQKTLSKKHIFCICHETKDLWNFGQAWSPHTNSPRWLLSLDRGSSSMSFLQPNTSQCFTYIKNMIM